MSSVFSINLALSLLVVTLTIGTATASPDEASGGFSTPSSLKRLVVLDFKLTGDLGGRNFEAAHKQRIRVASEKLRDDLKRNKLYHVVDDAAALAVIERWSSEQNLHHCNGCELDMAKQLDAEQVLVPWVFRMSMHVEIRDVATGRILMKKALDFRGDNDIGWTRATAYLIRDMKERRNMKSRPTEEFEDVLRFWFPERNGDHAAKCANSHGGFAEERTRPSRSGFHYYWSERREAN